jgi:hypothetical protein
MVYCTKIHPKPKRLEEEETETLGKVVEELFSIFAPSPDFFLLSLFRSDIGKAKPSLTFFYSRQERTRIVIRSRKKSNEIAIGNPRY